MKSILAAIGTALRSAFAFFRALISIPGRLVAGLFGGSAEPPPVGDSPLVRDLKQEFTEAETMQKTCENIAAIIAAWCADCIVADRLLPAPKPPRVSRAVADWLPGLKREECTELVCAGKRGISKHIDGSRPLPGVRRVQRLTSLSAWPAPAPVSPAPAFAAIATLAPRGPSAN